MILGRCKVQQVYNYIFSSGNVFVLYIPPIHHRPSEVEGEVVVQVAMEMSLDEWKVLQELSRHKAEFNLRMLDSKMPSKATVIYKSKRIEVTDPFRLELRSLTFDP